jgi:hypothetical protein
VAGVRLLLRLILVLVVFLQCQHNVGILTEPSLRWFPGLQDRPSNAQELGDRCRHLHRCLHDLGRWRPSLSGSFRGQKLYDGLLYLPIIIPEVTMAVMLLLFFAQGFQWMDSTLGWSPSFGLGTISLSHIAFNISFVTVVVRARLGQLDPRLEEAAADLYASRWQAFRRVTLPLIMPGVLGGHCSP